MYSLPDVNRKKLLASGLTEADIKRISDANTILDARIMGISEYSRYYVLDRFSNTILHRAIVTSALTQYVKHANLYGCKIMDRVITFGIKEENIPALQDIINKLDNTLIIAKKTW